jgi:cytochrome P450
MLAELAERPAHVPEALVRPYPIPFGGIMDGSPFDGTFQAMRNEPDIFYSVDAYPGGRPTWILRRIADLRTVYLDNEHFSTKDFAPFAQLVGETWSSMPVETDPPMHGLYRSFVNPLFAPKAMAAMEDKIRAYARDYILSFKAKGQCEFLKDFAFEFPIKVFLEMMGLPLEKTAEFMAWEMDLLHNSDLGAIAAATRNVVTYLRGEIADRRVNPTDDIITYGVQGQVDGRPLTDDELVGFTFNLFIGGLDTVSTNMAWQFKHLATHAEDQAFLRANPKEIPKAIEELMRAYAAVTTYRTCTKPVTINGVAMMPGDKVAMATPLAGRDPAEFDDPDTVRLDRRPRHVSFGYGVHTCVGMQLANREMRIAMEEFLAEIPPFRLNSDVPERTLLGGMIQPESVPLVW